MKNLAFAFGLALALASGNVGSEAAGSSDKVFKGEIMCTMCAQLGSHDRVGYQLTKKYNPKDCTLACVRMGSNFVLSDTAHKLVYKLDDQQRPRRFAGMKVQVRGSYDRDSNTIHVVRIQAASALAYQLPARAWAHERHATVHPK